MEYRRRRKAQRSGEGGGAGALRALILVIMFSLTAYLLIGTGLGKRLREGYAAKLLGGCAGTNNEVPLPTAITPTPLPLFDTPEPTPDPAAAGYTAEASLPGIEIHMIQLGFYSSEEECERAAEAIRAQGAAGYIYNDGGSLRLIAAAYSDEASAQSVRERLLSEGVESSVFTVTRNGVDLLVTADEKLIAPIETAFDMAFDAVTQLDELSIDMDANSRSVDYALNVLLEIRANAVTASQGIESSVAQNKVLELVESYYSDLAGYIDGASSARGDRTAFCSAVKELRVKAALRYAVLLGEIGG